MIKNYSIANFIRYSLNELDTEEEVLKTSLGNKALVTLVKICPGRF